jgi:hypothetical protein
MLLRLHPDKHGTKKAANEEARRVNWPLTTCSIRQKSKRRWNTFSRPFELALLQTVALLVGLHFSQQSRDTNFKQVKGLDQKSTRNTSCRWVSIRTAITGRY